MTTEPSPAVGQPGVPAAVGLRERKKLRTRDSIQDAALDLFIERGYEATTVEEIAAHAEVSVTTFFRYFQSKGDVIMDDPSHTWAAVAQAIVERPRADTEIEAVRRAIQLEWVAPVDPKRIVRQMRAIGTSDTLRGLALNLGTTWQNAVAGALATRRGLGSPDHACRLTAAVAVATFSNAVDEWVRAGATGELGVAIDTAFDLLVSLCRPWTTTKAKRG